MAALRLENRNRPHPPRAGQIEKPRTEALCNSLVYGAFLRADDGTRTHDLLHGKQTL